MAIKSKYPIKISIDDKPFSIVACQMMTASQKDELSEVTDKHSESFEKRDSLQLEITSYKEEFEINKHILSHGKVTQIVAVMFEQKTLNQDIFRLEKEMRELDKNIVSLNKAMEEIYERRFDLSVSGADKDALKKEMQTIGLSYQAIISEINGQVKEAKEKK